MKEFAKSVLYVLSIVVAVAIGMFQNEQIRTGGLPPCNESISLEKCGTVLVPGKGRCEIRVYVLSGVGTGKYGPSGTMLCETENCVPTEGLTAVECGG